MKRLPWFPLLLLLPLSAAADADGQQWMTVLLDGRKVGHALSERLEIDGKVQSRQRLELILERSGTRLQVNSDETAIESATGQPLSFRGEAVLAGDVRRYSGEVDDLGMLTVVLESAGSRDVRTMPWPKGALLAEGQRLALAAAEAGEQTTLSMRVYLTDALQAADLHITFAGHEEVAMPEAGHVRLRRVEKVLDTGEGQLPTQAWIDADLRTLRIRMPVFGTFLEMLECSQECALAPVQPSDLMERTLVRAPRSIPRAWLSRPVQYRLRALDGQPLELPGTAEQEVRLDHEAWTVAVRPGRSRDDETPPTEVFTRPNRWIESDAAEIVALAASAAQGSDDPQETMLRLERAVRRHIEVKSLRVGYASALESYRRREGDCTEHALLLAALGRARGIPTRIATGLVHADSFGGQRHVFVPHAWTQAWIDGRWVSFDAAQEGFGSGHIQLGSGDGEPWQFYQGVNQLGRIRIEAAQRLR
ncbi:MAG TPA: transglutaminase-like domain-containing protein [Xanthomonadaceae bacterium]|nr:transglutaminase-like domain-containing protein [Xanthomonadaceae bacterium]